MLNFNIYKFGAEDPELKRDHDISVQLEMAAITYVHTQRFFFTMLDFFTQFQQLQETMNSFRAASTSSTRGPGSSVAFQPPEPGTGRGSRVMLRITATDPLLVLPLSSSSCLVLLIDLGRLEVINKFQFAGDEGTISASKLSTVKSGELGGRRSRAHSGSRSSVRSRSSAKSWDRQSRRSRGGMSSDEESWAPPLKQLVTHR